MKTNLQKCLIQIFSWIKVILDQHYCYFFSFRTLAMQRRNDMLKEATKMFAAEKGVTIMEAASMVGFAGLSNKGSISQMLNTNIQNAKNVR